MSDIDPNKILKAMYKRYLLKFTLDDLIDCEVLSYEEWIKENAKCT